MNRITRLALVIGLAFIVASLSKSRGRSPASGYPFPTNKSHDKAPLEDDEALGHWAKEIGRDQREIRSAAQLVGVSKAAILDYFSRSSEAVSADGDSGSS